MYCIILEKGGSEILKMDSLEVPQVGDCIREKGCKWLVREREFVLSAQRVYLTCTKIG